MINPLSPSGSSLVKLQERINNRGKVQTVRVNSFKYNTDLDLEGIEPIDLSGDIADRLLDEEKMLQGILNHELPVYLRPDVSLDKIKQSGKHLPKFNLKDPVKGLADKDFDPDKYFEYIDNGFGMKKEQEEEEDLEEKTQKFI